jgi:hypothetical protein
VPSPHVNWWSPFRHLPDICVGDPGAMTASLYVTGTHVASVAHDPLRDGRDLARTVQLAHAVARPVVDGLADSACGVLVTAIADLDWQMVWGVPRCEECERLVG